MNQKCPECHRQECTQCEGETVLPEQKHIAQGWVDKNDEEIQRRFWCKSYEDFVTSLKAAYLAGTCHDDN